jgi:hypothetical protein
MKTHKELCAYGLWPKCNERGNCKKCSKTDKNMFIMKSKMLGHLQWKLTKHLLKAVLHNFWKFMRFSKTTYTPLYEIIIVRLGYFNFWARWVPKMLIGIHEKQRMVSSALIFFNTCTTNIVIHSPNKPKKLKQTLSARQLMATVFWQGKGNECWLSSSCNKGLH